MTEPIFAYTKKGRQKVRLLKNMGSGFYKCVNAYKQNTRRKDIYINELLGLDYKPIDPESLKDLPKLWSDDE